MLRENKDNAIRRIKIIQGQINKILSMVEEGTYCPDILMLTLAVQKALKQVDAQLLEGHLKTCVKRQMSKGQTEKAVGELLAIFQRSNK